LLFEATAAVLLMPQDLRGAAVTRYPILTKLLTVGLAVDLAQLLQPVTDLPRPSE